MFHSSRDTRLFLLTGVAAAAAALVLVLITGFVFYEALPALGHAGPSSFLADAGWNPTEQRFNLLPMLAASAAISLGAILVATPLGICAAIFKTYYAPATLKPLFYWSVILLAGIPSVVLGLWGLTVLVPIIGAIEPPGTSLAAGSLVLALMIVPTVILTSDAALRAVPEAYWRSAFAMGFTREATLLRIVLPAARRGIAAGALLALARALGETMVVLMITGNVVQWPGSIFSSVRALTSNIALEMAYAVDIHRSALFVSGLALIALVFVFSLIAAKLQNRKQRV